jgi:diaminopimelate epimerase
MMGRMRFAKGHGTGNDFVILPDPDASLTLTPHLVAALCDRRFGIGGDGVLRVVRAGSGAGPGDAAGAGAGPGGAAGAGAGPGDAAGAEPGDTADGGWFMDYWNGDGSYAEMCGNGVRVFARYLVSHGLAPGPEVRIMTRAGEVVARVGEDTVAATMPLPREYSKSSATVRGQQFAGVALNVGNPHLVCQVDDLAALDLSTVPDYDPIVFPDGVNVEFMTVDPEPVDDADVHVRMRVFERGSGETLSCGSGACAVAAVALGESKGTAAVDVPGGRLLVTLDGDECWLTGPAVIVAEGEFLSPI